MRGCPTISYGWGRGHIRVNNAAFRRYGLAEVVDTQSDCAGALRARARGRLERSSAARRLAALPVGRVARARPAAPLIGLAPALAPRRRRPVAPSRAGSIAASTGAAGSPSPSTTARIAQGTPAVLEQLARRAATARRSSSSASRSCDAVARRRDRRRRARGRAPRLPPHAPAAAQRRAALAADLDRAVDAIGEATGVRPTLLPAALRRLQPGALAPRAPPRLAAAALVALGSRLGTRATPQAIARRATRGLRAGDVVLLHDADDYSSPDSWRRTAAALPSVLEAVATLGCRSSRHPVDVARGRPRRTGRRLPAELARRALARDVAALEVAGAPFGCGRSAHRRRRRGRCRRSRARSCSRADEVVDAARGGRVERRDDAVGEVLDVDEAARLRAVAGDRERLARERLRDERGDHRGRPRARTVRDAEAQDRVLERRRAPP